MIASMRSVSLWRAKTLILDQIDWQINTGENWVVIGPNGAGKTSLIDILAARLYPSKGQVEVLGERLGKVEVAEMRQRIGFASPALAGQIPPEEKVRRAVLTAAWGMTASWKEDYDPTDQDRVNVLMKMFQVDHLSERAFHTLSQGEKQRVMVARALMIDPEMLVLDEPAAALDLAGRELLIGGLSELTADRRAPAMAMVTHHLEEIPPGFTHCLLLDKGKVAAQGKLSEVLTAKTLSQVFGLPLAVGNEQGRWWARSGNR